MSYKKHNWEKIRNDYVLNGLSQPELCKKYGVSSSQIGKIAKRENWLEKRKNKNREIAEKVEKKTIQNEVDRRVALNEEHIELFNKGLDLVKSLLDEYSEFQKKKKGNQDGSIPPVFIEKLFSCIEKGQKGQRLALGLDKEESAEDTSAEVRYVIGLDLNDV